MSSNEKPGGTFHSGGPLQGPALGKDEIPAILSRGMSFRLDDERFSGRSPSELMNIIRDLTRERNANDSHAARAGEAYAQALADRHLPTAAVDPADAELADAIAKGTEAWAGTPEDWVDELRGGAVEPARDVSAAAQKIAERVPLNERIRPNVEAAPWVIAEVKELERRIAVAAEAVRGAEAVGEAGTMPGTSGFTMAAFRAEDVPPGTKLYTTPPAGSVEVAGWTDAMHVAAARAIWEIRREQEDRCDQELEDLPANHSVWDEARAALTAALTPQEPEA